MKVLVSLIIWVDWTILNQQKKLIFAKLITFKQLFLTH